MAIRRTAFTIAAGDSREFTDPADWAFFQLVGPGDAAGVLELVFNSNQGADQSSVLQPLTNYLFKSDKPRGFKRLTLQNRAGIAVAVILMTGEGDFNPGAAGAAVSATIIGTPDVNVVGAGATVLFKTGKAHTADPAVLADNTTAAPLLDKVGRTITGPALPENYVDGTVGPIADALAHDVIPAQGVGVRVTITDLVIANADAANPALVTILDGATPRLVVTLQAGRSIAIDTRRLGAANAAWRMQVAVASTVYVSASGFKGG